MKLYKFRQLANDQDLSRLLDIIETNRFWCSKFSEMNDPIEGIFYATNPSNTTDLYNKKNRIKICSFSAEEAFHNPIMWGYYVEGFRGVAIEIEVEDNNPNIHKVEYISDVPNTNHINTILTSKLAAWAHEHEYRFIKETDENLNEIGTITYVYFGNPYGNLTNSADILRDNPRLRTYETLKRSLACCLDTKGIECKHVRVDGNRVTI